MNGQEPISSLVVTAREQTTMQSLMPWLQQGDPFLVVGPEGCGKAVLMQHCMSQLPVCHSLVLLH